MRDTSMRFKGLSKVGFRLFDKLFQLCNLANLFKGTDFILLVTINCKSRRVVSTVFKSR